MCLSLIFWTASTCCHPNSRRNLTIIMPFGWVQNGPIEALQESWMNHRVSWKPLSAQATTTVKSLFISSASAVLVSPVCVWPLTEEHSAFSIQHGVGTALCCFVCVVMAIWLRAHTQVCLASRVFQRPDWCSKRLGSNHDNHGSTSVQVPLIATEGKRKKSTHCFVPSWLLYLCTSHLSSSFTVWALCPRCCRCAKKKKTSWH